MQLVAKIYHLLVANLWLEILLSQYGLGFLNEGKIVYTYFAKLGAYLLVFYSSLNTMNNKRNQSAVKLMHCIKVVLMEKIGICFSCKKL